MQKIRRENEIGLERFETIEIWYGMLVAFKEGETIFVIIGKHHDDGDSNLGGNVMGDFCAPPLPPPHQLISRWEPPVIIRKKRKVGPPRAGMGNHNLG